MISLQGNIGIFCAQKYQLPSRAPLSAKYDLRQEILHRLDTFAPAEAPAAPPLRERAEISDRYKWNLSHIFPDWDAWQRAYDELDRKIGECAAFQGTLAQGADRLLAAYRLRDEIGQLEHKVWYYTSLAYDEDQRDNQLNARRQQVQILFAKDAQAISWFEPELLRIPLGTIQQWLT